MAATIPGDDGPFDPEKREMCSDGMCIGVIGPDGKCKTCRKPAGSGWTPATAGEPTADPGGEPEDEPEDEPDPRRERVPCPDGMCTGIIGRNGRCGTCGKSQRRRAS